MLNFVAFKHCKQEKEKKEKIIHSQIKFLNIIHNIKDLKLVKPLPMFI